MKRSFAILTFIAVSACAPFPKPVDVPQHGVTHAPVVESDSLTGRQAVEISVLIYNVWGLPWPLKANSPESLRKIGEILGEMRMAGTEPDIVLLQEAFTMKSQPILGLGGYPNIVGGPGIHDPSATISKEEAPGFVNDRSIWKGEKLGKWLNSGLAILSNFPIEETYAQPFRRRACAGFDCMSNKGMLLAAIHIPGVPEPIEIFTTHMNSKDASGVSPERSNTAHNLQAAEIRSFLSAEIADDRRALIVGGDFNTKGDRELLGYLTNNTNDPIVRVYCTQSEDRCDIRMSFDGDEPWLDTQDLQAFYPGARIGVTPIAIEALFDEPVDGRMLSDHDAYLVEYRVTWDPSEF
ncbi:MAG: endonuclease/exonuclease/phosphatase family protein [Alphaproteobacteria bacterium]